jgi:amino acid adenylation domain-containing protein
MGAMTPSWHNPISPLHELVRAQARCAPESVAAVYEGRWMTYGKLVNRSGAWAQHFRRLGVEKGTLVGLYLERSLEVPAIILAVLEAGGVCVPFDSSDPAQRVAAMIEETKPSLIVTQKSLRQQLPANAASLVVVDEQRVVDAPPPESSVTGDSPAFVLLTSGSTGTPKGVTISHSAVVARMFRPESDRPSAGSCMAIMKTPMSNSPFLGEMFAPLLYGCYFVIARPGGHQDLPYLANLIADYGVTHISMTTSVLQAFVECADPALLRSLRTIYCGGEVVAEDLRRRLAERLEAVRLVVTYGTTEAGHALSHECAPHERLDGNRIGRPITHAQVQLFDDDYRPTPTGQVGEMYLGGPRLATGYWNRPASTAERFVPDPFSTDAGDRLYRSGDLGYQTADGNFAFKGRIDHQVKIRGNRVELFEIEAALKSDPRIREAAVLAHKNDGDDADLVAYVVPAQRPGPTAAEIRSRLAERLPYYMVPRTWLIVDEIPLTAAGKADRARLAAELPGFRDQDPPRIVSKAIEPVPILRGGFDASNGGKAESAMTLEERLAAVWAGVLQVPCVGLQDDFFFDLGGDSLLAAQVIAITRQTLGIDLAFNVLFDAPTVAQLAEAIRRNNPRLAPGPIHEPASVRSTQEPDQFCELLHADDGGMPLVCVGDSRPISLMLKRIQIRRPVYLLTIDGLVVWPPQYLSAAQQVEFYVRSLECRCPGRKLTLIGWSYGGTLAYELAAALCERRWPDVDVVLIEPATPVRFLSYWRSRVAYRFARRALSIRRLAAKIRNWKARPRDRSISANVAEMPDGLSRWNAMHEHYRENTTTLVPRPLRGRLALIGSEEYHARFAEGWRQTAGGQFEQCIFSNTDDHFACFREPYADQWLGFVERWQGDPAICVRSEPMPSQL